MTKEIIEMIISSTVFLMVFVYLMYTWRMHVRDKLIETQKLFKHNAQVVNNNKALINKAEIQIYNAKESVLFLHQHYSDLTNLLIRIEQINQIDLSQAIDITANAARSVENHFIETFHQSPQQYALRKTHITGVTKTGEQYLGSSSIN